MSATALQQPSFADPNDGQRAASDPTSSVWVNASAGSGKTKVLTERVIRLLLNGVRPEKILCLTYTRAGAAEMSNRITNKLSEWASCDDTSLENDLDAIQGKASTGKQRDNARRLFARVLSCPGGLRIRTIHSFCQEILSRFPLEAGLPPHFSLIDEQDLATLSREVLDELLFEAGNNPASPLAQSLSILVATQGEYGFEAMLQEAIGERARLTEAAQKHGGYERLYAHIRSFLHLEPEDTAEKFRRHITESAPESDILLMASWWVKGSERYLKRGKGILDFLESSPSHRTTLNESYLDFFLKQDRDIFSDAYIASKEIRAKHPEIDAFYLREATRLQLLLERIEAAQIAETTQAVLHFGQHYAEKLAARKAARDLLDYDDLIIFTEKLLNKPGIAPWILYKLDNGIDHILVDEAQDTSGAQWNIVQALTAEFYAGEGAQSDKSRTLFVVGDEKQSIFSFQNADPEAFIEKRDYFEERFVASKKKFEKIPMHTSFRSAGKILAAVDAIFADPATHEGVSPEPVIHTAFNRNKAGHIEVWPLLKPEDDKEKSDGTWQMPIGYEDETDTQAELAQQIAYKIKSLIRRGEGKPGDIMILLRRRGRFADLMVRALKTAQIPVTGVDRMRLIHQLPVMDMLSMLRFVLLPEDDLNLATLLRSPLIGLSEEELMELAIGRKETLWHSLKSAPAFSNVHDYLTLQLNRADYSTPFAFLSTLLNMPCPGNNISGRKALWSRLGDESLDPIDELLNEAQNFGQRRTPSLQNFLSWLTQSDKEIKRELDHGNKQSGGQVRIMTVHASKGLEAPIVFLPDTVALPRENDLPKIHWTRNGIPLFLSKQPVCQQAAQLWQTARKKQLQEYRRLFYVALTRAAERLYICGWQGKHGNNKVEESWYGLAEKALRPLDEDYLIEKTGSPVAEIIFADPPLPQTAVHQNMQIADKEVVLPIWATQIVASPVKTSAYLQAPSQPATVTPDAAYARGRIIHRLLQSLPDVDPPDRLTAITRFLSQPRHNLVQAQRDEIAHEVTRLMEDETFAILFAKDSIAEVPLTGIIDGIPVFRQIDRLCLRDDEVWIVDYKTNRPPPQDQADIPDAYRQQLDEYRILLSGIYTGKKIRCFLLWTYAPRLMEII